MQFLDSLLQSTFLPIQPSLVFKQVYVNTEKVKYFQTLLFSFRKFIDTLPSDIYICVTLNFKGYLD